MKNWKKLTALLLALVMLAALTGCGPKAPADDAQPSPGETASPSPAPDDGKTLTVCLGEEPDAMDPALNSGLVSHLFESLMKWAPEGAKLGDGVNAATLAPGMAERYERVENEDGTATYTFHLRQAKWSDEKPVTAQDFVYAWQRLARLSAQTSYGYLLDCVVNAPEIAAGTKEATELAAWAADDQTFCVTVHDVPYFLELCAMPLTCPLRQDAVEAGGNQWIYDPETCVSNGPYRLERWQYGVEMILTRNEQYYAKPAGPERIAVLFEADETAKAAYEAKEVDFLLASDAEKPTGSAPYAAVNYLTFQTRTAPFNDPLVRQAFALAIDRDAVAKAAVGAKTPAGALVPSGISDGEMGGKKDFRAAGGDYLDPSAKAYAANCDKARALLAQAGHEGGAGLGEVVYLYNANPVHKAVAQAIQEMWQKELGATVTLKEVEWGSYLADLHAGEFSVARGRWVADYDDPATFLELWSGDNDGGYQSESFDALMARAEAAENAKERAAALHLAEDQMVGVDWALAPLYFENRAYLLQGGWSNVCYTPTGNFIFSDCVKK